MFKFWRNKKTTLLKCSECGEIHKNWSALTFSTPTPFHNLTEKEKSTIGTIGSDFCVVKHINQIDRFIRVVLKQKVNDYSEDLEYGLWVSLSEKNFENYSDNYDNENHQTEYFGWLSSDLPDYNNSENIPTTVVTKIGNERPEIFPHKDFKHQFVKDYYNGISKQEAERRIHQMIKNI